jgi:hypothetical protein
MIREKSKALFDIISLIEERFSLFAVGSNTQEPAHQFAGELQHCRQVKDMGIGKNEWG